ncbi:DUF4956 domain-containing protein [Gemella sp. GH3]|uniref:DUF4956 domain-containing protein n=1 Tax=unclassified Gemella TaxID=2624949 RepID=UPI0015D0CFBF|nr:MULTISPECIES: DUF4956 domain-containing protein [unclassified Gemella]MBF0713380.1 DUF4956 domain-containing protein [Gemella sp. GH3.1]NYS50332.1 DUF4956 domain-containing protein [Gemella sp. GH3]
MQNMLFNNLFSSSSETTISTTTFLVSIAVALVLGVILALAYSYKTIHTKEFMTTIAVLPAIVHVVIFLVNGNAGAGIAVMGAFSLIRFRSAAGGAKELLAIFMSMAVGLATGMGYIAIAAFFTIVMTIIVIVYERTNFGEMKEGIRQLTVTIPENLDYEEIFDDLFKEQLNYVELLSVKTSDMGSLFKLRYNIKLKEGISEKQFLDAIRVRNGNLEVAINRHIVKESGL